MLVLLEPTGATGGPPLDDRVVRPVIPPEENSMSHDTTPALGRITASALALVGLAVGTLATLYIAGAFGISTATANNIVRAYEIGGWALTVALMAFSAGTAGAILLVIRRYITSRSRAWLVA